ncbi:unnamed protein product [Cochlearia groenlandica]
MIAVERCRDLFRNDDFGFFTVTSGLLNRRQRHLINVVMCIWNFSVVFGAFLEVVLPGSPLAGNTLSCFLTIGRTVLLRPSMRAVVRTGVILSDDVSFGPLLNGSRGRSQILRRPRARHR